MTELDQLEAQIEDSWIPALRDIVKRARRMDVSSGTREQAWRIIDAAEDRIRVLSGAGGDY